MNTTVDLFALGVMTICLAFFFGVLWLTSVEEREKDRLRSGLDTEIEFWKQKYRDTLKQLLDSDTKVEELKEKLARAKKIEERP